jgi:hypothetical protein
VLQPSEDKSGHTKDSFYEQLEQVFNQFPKHHIKILPGVNAKAGKEGFSINQELQFT